MHRQNVIEIKTYKSKRRIFKPGQEEETGNAEEQPASSNVLTMTENEGVFENQHLHSKQHKQKQIPDSSNRLRKP